MHPKFLYFYHDDQGNIKGISPKPKDVEFEGWKFQKVSWEEGSPYLRGEIPIADWFFTVDLPVVKLTKKKVHPSSIPSMFALVMFNPLAWRDKTIYVTKKNDPTVLLATVEPDKDMALNSEYSYYEEQ